MHVSIFSPQEIGFVLLRFVSAYSDDAIAKYINILFYINFAIYTYHEHKVTNFTYVNSFL